MISLPNSSKYVLIDISSLTHFLCRNLFVMSSLISILMFVWGWGALAKVKEEQREEF